jgi:hypothetical protein
MQRRAASAWVLSLGLTAAALAGPAEDWVARARAYLGSDRALEAVNSIRFTGTLELTERVPSKDNPDVLVDRPLQLPVEIIFQKPDQQRITVTMEKVIDVTALDGYDGWQRRVDTQNAGQWQLTLLDAQRIKQLRANTWENLHFFRGIEKRGGRVEYKGETTLDGATCVKLLFIHSESIIFHRYFEKATGRLLKTETESGVEIREEGELLVNGVRFPKRVVQRSPDGQKTAITFDRITLNEMLPPSEFAVPPLAPR